MNRPNIVLIHGAWADGSCWSAVIERLQSDGFHVMAPQFPLSSLGDDVARLRQVLAFQDGPTLVVGHSYGGQIMTALGADAPNVVGLVYVAAFGLKKGESLGKLLSQGPVTPALAHLFTDAQGFGWLSEDDFVNHFAADVDVIRARVMYAVQQALSLSTFKDVMDVPAWKSLPSWYLVAQNDEALPPDVERMFAARMGATTIEIPSSHVAMVSHPKEVVGLIERAAEAALAAAPQHHDQVPGFYRLKVGDLEVTALYDGTGVFDPHWLNGTKATMDGVAKALHEDPHMLDVVDSGFLVNTGKQLILVDAGAGTWWGGGALGRLAGSLRSAGYAPEEVDIVLVTHLHSDHVGGLTTQDGKRVFPNADVYVAKAESDFWLSPEIAAKAPKDAQPFFQSAQAITAPYIKAGKWHTFSGSEPFVDGMQVVPLPGHTPGNTGYAFSSKGHTILFWGDIVHAQRVQLQHPEVTATFDIDQIAAAATRHPLLRRLADEDALIASPHNSSFPPMGRLRKEARGYSWVPVIFTDRWDER